MFESFSSNMGRIFETFCAIERISIKFDFTTTVIIITVFCCNNAESYEKFNRK